MKKLLLALILFFIAISTYAQPTKDEVSYIQSTWGMEKRDIVKKSMVLDDNEANGFWEVYDKYEDSRKELGKDRINTIADYAQNYATLTDAKAEELIKKSLSNQTKFLELLNTVYDQMKTVISPLKAVQFIQLENYLDSMIKIKIMAELPLVGEIKK